MNKETERERGQLLWIGYTWSIHKDIQRGGNQDTHTHTTQKAFMAYKLDYAIYMYYVYNTECKTTIIPSNTLSLSSHAVKL